MPFSRPSLADIIRRNEGEIESRVVGTPLLRKSLLRIIARMVAGAAHMLFGYLAYLAVNLLPDRAEAEWLRRWARIYRVEERDASYAEGTATVAATMGTTVPAGTKMVRQDGIVYEVSQAAIASSGTVAVNIVAVEPGASGNTDAGTVLSLQSPVPGITASFNVAADITTGANAETTEQLRERVLLRIQNSPQGGSEVDYKRWALDVAGVTRAWVYQRWLGAGTVGIAIVNDNASPITPGADLIQAVQDYITDPARKPVTAEVTVFAPELLPVDLNIQLSPPEAQGDVVDSLAEFFSRVGEPGVTIRLSQISEAISLTDGENWHRIVSPTTDVLPSANQIPTLGAVTWA